MFDVLLAHPTYSQYKHYVYYKNLLYQILDNREVVNELMMSSSWWCMYGENRKSFDTLTVINYLTKYGVRTFGRSFESLLPHKFPIQDETNITRKICIYKKKTLQRAHPIVTHINCHTHTYRFKSFMIQLLSTNWWCRRAGDAYTVKIENRLGHSL